LLRVFRGPVLQVGEQRVLQGVGSLRWSYYAPSLGWVDRWPPSPELKDRWPGAIAADIVLAPGGTVNGSLRRVTLLPARP
jgi:general secretion pathway protein J